MCCDASGPGSRSPRSPVRCPWTPAPETSADDWVAGWRRSSCTAADKVYGDAHAIIRFPHKLVWYAKYAPELFDVRADPDEGRDLSSTAPEVLSELSTELQRQLSATPNVAPRATLDPSTAERLRALGYAVPNAQE